MRANNYLRVRIQEGQEIPYPEHWSHVEKLLRTVPYLMSVSLVRHVRIRIENVRMHVRHPKLREKKFCILKIV